MGINILSSEFLTDFMYFITVHGKYIILFNYCIIFKIIYTLSGIFYKRINIIK